MVLDVNDLAEPSQNPAEGGLEVLFTHFKA